MRIERVELREIQMSLIAPFETSFGRTERRRIVLLRVRDGDGAEGWGECTAGETPFYNHETTDTAWLILTGFAVPLILNQELAHPSEIAERLTPIRGHQMAKAALETACWDLQAKREGRPLWQLLGGERREIPCGVSIGIQPTVEELLERIEQEVAAGYQRVKLKIRPGLDVDRVARVRERFPTVRLMVDANAAYTLQDAPVLEQLDAFNLMMIEQPLAFDDLVDHATLQRRLQTPICLDESILTVRHARQALEIGACRIINIKLGRVGGYTEAKRIHDYCAERRVSVWCGGMLESGIGRAHNVALSTLRGFTLPGDVSASKRYWEHDIIDPAIEVTPQGTISVSTEPGLGYEIDLERIEALTVRREVLS